MNRQFKPASISKTGLSAQAGTTQEQRAGGRHSALKNLACFQALCCVGGVLLGISTVTTLALQYAAALNPVFGHWAYALAPFKYTVAEAPVAATPR